MFITPRLYPSTSSEIGIFFSEIVFSISSAISHLVCRTGAWKEKSPEYLPGKLLALMVSRTVTDSYNWMLNPAVFQRMLRQMGPLRCICLTEQQLLYFGSRGRSNRCVSTG